MNLLQRILHRITGCYDCRTSRQIDGRGIVWIGSHCNICGRFEPNIPSTVQSRQGWQSLADMGHPSAAWKPEGE